MKTILIEIRNNKFLNFKGIHEEEIFNIKSSGDDVESGFIKHLGNLKNKIDKDKLQRIIKKDEIEIEKI